MELVRIPEEAPGPSPTDIGRNSRGHVERLVKGFDRAADCRDHGYEQATHTDLLGDSGQVEAGAPRRGPCCVGGMGGGSPRLRAIMREKTAFIQNYGDHELRTEVTRLTEESNVVVAEGTARVTKKDGRSLSVLFCDIFELTNGKIQRKSSFGALIKESAWQELRRTTPADPAE